VARIGVALGMDVIYHDLLDIPEANRHGARPVGRGELLANADVLTIHVDPRRPTGTSSRPSWCRSSRRR
jgi:phosphoglycerate dehydrogenase-like enzyme